MKMLKLGIVAAVFFVAAGFAGEVYAGDRESIVSPPIATGRAQVTARVERRLEPIRITKVRDLEFGTLKQGERASVPHNRGASFTVRGSAPMSINVPDSVTLVLSNLIFDDGGEPRYSPGSVDSALPRLPSMKANLNHRVLKDAFYVDGSISKTVNIGGDLSADRSQSVGAYTGNVVITATYK